jgi:hypothetical protein
MVYPPPKDASFLLVDRVITLLVSLQNAPGIQPALSINQRPVIFKLLRTVRRRAFRRQVRHIAERSIRFTSYFTICARIVRCIMHVQPLLCGWLRKHLRIDKWNQLSPRLSLRPALWTKKRHIMHLEPYGG